MLRFAKELQEAHDLPVSDERLETALQAFAKKHDLKWLREDGTHG
jgi:hypothetical protein